MFDRNTLIMYGILAVSIFLGGFVVGYLTWGAGGEGIDYKAMLKDAAGYIARLENENAALSSAPASTAGKARADAAAGEARTGEPVEETSSESAAATPERANVLEEQSAALMAALDEEKGLAKRHLELTERLQSVMGAQKALEAENARLQAAVTEKDKLMAELDQSKAEAQACLEQKEKLSLAKAELEANINQNQALIDQNESLQVQLRKMTGEVDVMRSRLAEIQSIADANKEGGPPESQPAAPSLEESQEKPAN